MKYLLNQSEENMIKNNRHHLGKIKIYKEVSKIYEKYKHACNDAKL